MHFLRDFYNTIYLVEIPRQDKTIYKLGVSNDVLKRIEYLKKEHENNKNIQLLYVRKCGKIAFEIEQTCKELIKKSEFRHPLFKKHHEHFVNKDGVVDEIISLIDDLCNSKYIPHKQEIV